MENIYKNLLDKSNKKVESSIQSFVDGKIKYTVKSDTNGDTIYTTETSIAKLDGELLGYDPVLYDDLDHLLDEDGSVDYFFDDFEGLVSFTDEGKVKVSYFDEEFQTDKFIVAKGNSNNPSIMGLIVDLKRDEDFTDLYNNGVECSMPSCKEYSDAVARGEDPEDDEIRDYLDEDEIRELIREFNAKAQAGAELIPQGLYVIVDSKIYYLTAREYYDIYYDSREQYRMFELVDDAGIQQLNAKLLGDKKEVLATISQIIKSKELENKNYLDLNNEASIGTTKEVFLENLLSGNEETYAFLASELKPKENVL